MARVWRYAVHDEPRVKSLSREMGVLPLVAQVLLARGVESADAARENRGTLVFVSDNG